MRDTVRRAARATVQLAGAVALAVGVYLFIPILLLTVVAAVTVVGISVVPVTVYLIREFATTKRRKVTEWSGRVIPEAYQSFSGPLRFSLNVIRHDPTTYADLRWLFAYFGYGAMGCLAVPLWVVGLPVDGVRCGLLHRPAVVLPLIVRLADRDAAWSSTLLWPPPQARLAQRIQELTTTRADAIAAHATELRRIERDLHDGAQARLVSLTMRLGLAKRALGDDPDRAHALLDEAQGLTEGALTELRHIVRGIHPPILSDRGLAGAVRALAADSGLEVRVRVDDVLDSSRVPAAVETAAYFVVAEALTNAAKYSGCQSVDVRITHARNGLRVFVRDDGVGGALPTAESGTGGTGLLGMQRRVAALDGTFTLTSPAGGPTVIDVELPCAW